MVLGSEVIKAIKESQTGQSIAPKPIFTSTTLTPQSIAPLKTEETKKRSSGGGSSPKPIYTPEVAQPQSIAPTPTPEQKPVEQPKPAQPTQQQYTTAYLIQEKTITRNKETGETTGRIEQKMRFIGGGVPTTEKGVIPVGVSRTTTRTTSGIKNKGLPNMIGVSKPTEDKLISSQTEVEKQTEGKVVSKLTEAQIKLEEERKTKVGNSLSVIPISIGIGALKTTREIIKNPIKEGIRIVAYTVAGTLGGVGGVIAVAEGEVLFTPGARQGITKEIQTRPGEFILETTGGTGVYTAIGLGINKAGKGVIKNLIKPKVKEIDLNYGGGGEPSPNVYGNKPASFEGSKGGGGGTGSMPETPLTEKFKGIGESSYVNKQLQGTQTILLEEQTPIQKITEIIFPSENKIAIAKGVKILTGSKLNTFPLATIELTNQTTKQQQATVTKEQSALKIEPIQILKQENILESTIKSKTIPIIITKPKVKTRQSTQQTTTTEQIQIQETVQQNKTIQKTIAKQKIITFPTFPKSEETQKQNKLFGVEVRRKGIFKQVGIASSFDLAFEKGKRIVEQTASASFRITGGSGFSLSPRFKESIRERGVFIQKARYRISSPGEKREIPGKAQFINRKNKVRGFKL